MQPDLNIQGAEVLDWNVRGRSSPGLERPGQQKGEETAGKRSGEENMNTSKEQMRKDTTNESREAGGEGAEGKAAKHVDPGQEQPGKQRTRTRTSGGKAALDWSVWGSMKRRKGCGKKLQGEHEQEPSTGEKEDKKNNRREEGGKGEEGEADKHMEPGLDHPGKQRTRTATSGGRRLWTETSGEVAAQDWNIRGNRRRRKRRRREAARKI